jgi:hypothetical protein
MSDDDQVRWQFEPLTIEVEPGSYNSQERVDLSFYRAKGDVWRPISASALSNLSKADYEVIEALFEEPKDRLESIGLRVIHKQLLKDILKQYARVRLLVLVDSAVARSLLRDYLSMIRREGEVAMMPAGITTFAGFALLGLDRDSQPVEGACHACSISSSDGALHEHSWRWEDYAFSEPDSQTCEEKSCDRLWESKDALETAGAALFSLIWQPALMQAMEHEISHLEGGLRNKSQLITRAEDMIERVRAC